MNKINKKLDITIVDHVDLVSDNPISEETRRLLEKTDLNSDLRPYTQNFFPFWNTDISNEVTEKGRSTLRELLKKATELGYNVTVADSIDGEGRFHKDGEIFTFDEMKENFYKGGFPLVYIILILVYTFIIAAAIYAIYNLN